MYSTCHRSLPPAISKPRSLRPLRWLTDQKAFIDGSSPNTTCENPQISVSMYIVNRHVNVPTRSVQIANTHDTNGMSPANAAKGVTRLSIFQIRKIFPSDNGHVFDTNDDVSTEERSELCLSCDWCDWQNYLCCTREKREALSPRSKSFIGVTFTSRQKIPQQN